MKTCENFLRNPPVIPSVNAAGHSCFSLRANNPREHFDFRSRFLCSQTANQKIQINSKILCPQNPSIIVPRPRRLRDEKRAMATRMVCYSILLQALYCAEHFDEYLSFGALGDAHTLNFQNCLFYLSSIINITVSRLLYPLNGFKFYFLLRDTECTLSIKQPHSSCLFRESGRSL